MQIVDAIKTTVEEYLGKEGEVMINIGMAFPEPGHAEAVSAWASGESGIRLLHTEKLCDAIDSLGPLNEFMDCRPIDGGCVITVLTQAQLAKLREEELNLASVARHSISKIVSIDWYEGI